MLPAPAPLLLVECERAKNEDDDDACFVFASGIGSEAGVVPAGANAGGFAASNLKPFGVLSPARAAATDIMLCRAR